jgi:acid stress-induced BolA-like protein IbaG/YrbA
MDRQYKRVLVVSNEFENKSKLSQHRLIHEILKEELSLGVHALSIQTFTPTSWEQSGNELESPPCLGGMKSEVTMHKEQ